MFNCGFCGREFTRKFNLERHLKSKHNNNLNNGSKDITNQFQNTSSDVLFDPVDKETQYNVERKTLPVRDDSVESSDDDDGDNNNDIRRNNTDEDASQALQENIENNIVESKEGLNQFDQRIRAVTEAIKSKFHALRQSRNAFQNYGRESPENQEDSFTNIVSKNNNATIFEAKLPELLQCMLDILMIKELQNVDIRDKDEEISDGENKNIKLKRKFNSVDEQGDEDEVKSPKETPLKRLKYDNSIEQTNGNDNGPINPKFIVNKYWHNPNTLVDELKNLISTTDIGQQISTIIHRLNVNNINSINYFEYVEHKEERNELKRNLSELKETDIGQQIFCILNELEKAEIIEPIDYGADGADEHFSDDHEENSITDDDIDESVTVEESSTI